MRAPLIVQTLAALALLITAPFAIAASIDGITPGLSTWQQATTIAQTIQRSMPQSGGWMPIQSQAAYANQAIGLTSLSTPIGQTKATLWLAAANNGIVQYLRLHTPRQHAKHALNTIHQLYQGRSLAFEQSNETGVSDIIYYDTINATWIRNPDSDSGPEIICASYDTLLNILSRDLNQPQWANTLQKARLSLTQQRP